MNAASTPYGLVRVGLEWLMFVFVSAARRGCGQTARPFGWKGRYGPRRAA